MTRNSRKQAPTRTETDSLGKVQVPAQALWGAQTQRAVENFPVSGQVLPRELIRALGLIKAAAAETLHELGQLEGGRMRAIRAAALEVSRGDHDAHFPVDVYQTGSGTSSNMNANEVIARLAGERLGSVVHPNDEVNRAQSSNDTFPSAVHLACCQSLDEQLVPALRHLQKTIGRCGAQWKDVIKTGRTHLMDAMPLSVGQELSGWAQQVNNALARIDSTRPRLLQLAQGATAIGTGINAPKGFSRAFCRQLSKRSGLPLKPSANPFESLSSIDAVCELSGQLKTLACALMKISNDLRWMNSGPQSGLAEIRLPALQPGSSIMPGKVNPVIPESVCMVAARVIGNDASITVAAQSGNFQLNVMQPLAGVLVLESLRLLASASRLLADRAIRDMVVCQDHLAARVSRNPILVTALAPSIGYELSARIAKRAIAEDRPLIEVALQMTELSERELRRLLDPARLTRGGVPQAGGGRDQAA